MRKRWLLIMAGGLAMIWLIWWATGLYGERLFTDFMANHERRVADLSNRINRAHFRADTGGRPGDYLEVQRLQLELSALYQDQQDLSILCRLKRWRLLHNPIDRRELQLVYRDYLNNHVDLEQMAQIIQLQTRVEQEFAAYRPRWKGRPVTNGQLAAVLKNSTDSRQLESAWEAGKQVGAQVENDLITLVKLRNSAARQLGYRNFFVLQLEASELDEKELDRLFARLDDMTREAYRRRKSEMDLILARRSGISPRELMPWHYQQFFLQEAPPACIIDLDSYYAHCDVIKAVTDYYRELGLPVDDVVARSDLYERRGKYPYAYCMDIDRQGDVRVLANVHNDAASVATLLHEFGHAAYDRYIDQGLPWRLREPAQVCTTEAVAMMLAKRYADPGWLQKHLGLSAREAHRMAPACRRANMLNSLIFSRWAQVMYHFEKALYENPDQDLDGLWWNLVEKYQLISRPPDGGSGDWAAKVHLATAPGYYPNYLLGELIACQLEQAWQERSPQKAGGEPGLGAYLRRGVFAAGARYPWSELVRRATGENLNPLYFAREVQMSP